MVEVKGFEPPLTPSCRLSHPGLHCQSCGQKLLISGHQVETDSTPGDVTGTVDVSSTALLGHSGSTIRAQSKNQQDVEQSDLPEDLQKIIDVWPALSLSLRETICLTLDLALQREKTIGEKNELGRSI